MITSSNIMHKEIVKDIGYDLDHRSQGHSKLLFSFIRKRYMCVPTMKPPKSNGSKDMCKKEKTILKVERHV